MKSTPTLPSAGGSPPRRRRVRLWIVLAAVSIGWKVLVLTLGAAVPRWVIGDGLDLVPPDARAYAQQAKVTALGLWSHPIERLGIVQAIRVVRIDSVPSQSALTSKGAAASPTAHCNGRSATVRAYTYFAIPYSEARTACDTGVVQYRVFRRKS